jgi:uncharacterized membrane protein YeaQ/YmgE (transglycosylase-associated protein family)
MSRKTLIYVGATIGSVVGGYVPALWGADPFSMTGIVFGSIGAFVGLFLAIKLT